MARTMVGMGKIAVDEAYLKETGATGTDIPHTSC